MIKQSFMYTVEMLAEMTSGNKQYLSKKIKGMAEDPDISLQAVLRSKKEGYQIPEEEVLRCFPKVTPRQVQEFKERYLNMAVSPKVKMLTRQEAVPAQKYMEKENERLIQWKVRMAATAPDKKNSPGMREYLQQEIEAIRQMREEKIKESVRLELFINNCDKMILEIQQKLWPEEDIENGQP